MLIRLVYIYGFPAKKSYVLLQSEIVYMYSLITPQIRYKSLKYSFILYIE